MTWLAVLRSPVTWAVAGAIAIVIGLWAYGSHQYQQGYDVGAATKETEWQTRVEAERAALQGRIDLLQKAEATRSAQATLTIEQATRSTNDILNAVRGQGGVCVPHDVARRLWDDANGNALIQDPASTGAR